MVNVETQTEGTEQRASTPQSTIPSEDEVDYMDHDESWNSDEEMSSESSEDDYEDEPSLESPSDQK